MPVAAQAQCDMMGLDEAYRPNVRAAGHRYVEEAKTKVSAVRADKCADKCVHTCCAAPRRAARRNAWAG